MLWLLTARSCTSGLAAGDLGEPPPGESMQLRSVRSCSILLSPSRLPEHKKQNQTVALCPAFASAMHSTPPLLLFAKSTLQIQAEVNDVTVDAVTAVAPVASGRA